MSYSLNLQPKQTANMKQGQRLMMLPQMQQAIHLLQMSVMDLSTVIDEAIENNPLLEYSKNSEEEEDRTSGLEMEISEKEEGEDLPAEKEISFNERDFEILKHIDQEFRDYFSEAGNQFTRRTAEEESHKTFCDSTICAEDSLFDHLMRQAQETFATQKEKEIAQWVIGNLDERGFLSSSLEEMAVFCHVEQEKIQEVVKEIQTFDPYGIAAKDTQESLLIQLRCLGKEKTLAYEIVARHYNDLLHNRIPRIQKAQGCSKKEITEAIERHIAKLDLHPGNVFSKQPIQPIVPDVTIRQEGELLLAQLNDDTMPEIRLNQRYMRMIDDETISEEAKDFIRKKVQSAKWLVRNIDQRNETVLRIAQSLAKSQKEFFSLPDGKLVPLTMKMVASELNVHESTIARAVANKYINSLRGLIPLRFFFSNSYHTDKGQDVSSRTVRDTLKEIINSESKEAPLADELLSEKLKEKGISCARRTIAKYRHEMNIGKASQRKKHFQK